MNIRITKLKVIVISTICLLMTIVPVIASLYQYFEIEAIRNIAGDNYVNIKKAINYFPKGTEKYEAMKFLIDNMKYRRSYDDISVNYVRKVIMSKDNYSLDTIFKNMVKQFPEPVLRDDIKSINAEYLIENVEDAYDAWSKSPWKEDVDFKHFCNYILPYNIDKEPIVQWRKHLRNKYSHIIKNVLSKEDAYNKVFDFLKKNFFVEEEKFPYEKDALLLDLLGSGDCKSRAFYMIYVMRALGIPVAFDYSPVWANYGTNSHSWPVLVTNNDNVITGIHDKEHIIDGTYEPFKYTFSQLEYPYTVDSLKKISKIYRKCFNRVIKCKDVSSPLSFLSPFDKDVTNQYPNLTDNGIVEIDNFTFSSLYLCTFKQQEGWTPISRVTKKMFNTVDIGGLIHDCLIIIGKSCDGIITPVSQPYIISHNNKPRLLKPVEGQKQTVKLFRKYMLGNRWTNRWADFIGTRIESSNDKSFKKGCSLLYICKDLPKEKIKISIDKEKLKRYIRILPKDGRYPVFAEIALYKDSKQQIDEQNFKIFSIGKGLTGDTIVTKSLIDGNEATTFYKQFPFWIGLDVNNCHNDICNIELTLWNDYNRIIQGHEYELFYFDKKWISLGVKKATNEYLVYEDVPVGCLFLLRNYSYGKEERVFTYENGKQIWW